MSFLDNYVLEGSSYGRCNQSSWPSFFIVCGIP